MDSVKSLEIRLILTNHRDDTPCWLVGVLIPDWQYGWGGVDFPTVHLAIDDFLDYFRFSRDRSFSWFESYEEGVLSPEFELPWADPV